ncbi:MAG TPA: TonB-dependent receptor [Burkholderiales bacterium]|nr:TonB-dependent receptor [Burkholderiales bacterium]
MRKNKQSPVVFNKKPSIVATQIALAVMAPSWVYAQTVQTAERVERVEVTGTRLPQLSTEGPSPVTVMDAQDIRMDGQSKTEDLLNSLPQVMAQQTSAMSNGATGTAQVNLRNLGATRNLVLLNGRRLPAGSPRTGTQSPAADLNQIPAPLIQRVELLTGGASAVYGSDAVTGVVNFIMNDRFEGLQMDVYHSFYNHQQQNPDGIADIVAKRGLTNPAQFQVPGDVGSDGAINSISLLMGKNFADNKGNATAYLQYKKEDPVLQASRDFSACALNPGAKFTCGGSGTSYPGEFISGLGAADPGNVFTIADAAGNARPFASATDQYNFGPLNYYRRPSEQYAAAAFAHLDITPKVRAYTELGFHDNHSLAQIAPSGSFFTQQTISWDNPLLSASEKNAIAAGLANPALFSGPGQTADILLARRNVEGGGRVDDIRHTSYRGVAGAKGEFSPGLSYDAFVQTARVLYQNVYHNDFSITRIGRALDVVAGPGGVPTCRSVINGTDPNCVPWNIWAIGGVNQAALDYLQTPGLQNGETRMHVMNASVQADLGTRGVKMPAARDGLALAFGVERRKEALTLQTDTEFQTGDLAGQGGATPSVQGKLDVDEWFTEARLPIAQRVPMADLLSINGSYRRSSYSTGITTNTYGLGAEWAPVHNYRIRGSYAHAIRHANIQELFQPQTNGLTGMVDPCAGPAPTATAAQCAQSGVSAAQYGSVLLANPAGQYNVLTGGNPALTPETANTYTLGLVMTPVRSVTATLDWWDIKIDDAVGFAPAQTTLNNCVFSGQFCNLVQRDGLGTLWITPAGKVVATNQNLGGYHVSGLDIGINWTMRMGANGFGINFLGSYLDKWEFEPIKGQGKFDCAGLVGPNCGTPNPVWRHKVRGTWATPWNLDLALTWRHIDEVKNELTSSSPLLAGTPPATDAKLDSRDYFDLAGLWTINKTFSLRAGVNNMFDIDPPIVSNVFAGPGIYGNGNTFPGIYDTLGRQVFMNLTMKF